MDEPQILEALSSKSVYELTTDEKIKILNCLMLQVPVFKKFYCCNSQMFVISWSVCLREAFHPSIISV
jgi:hypothetical protein